MSAKVLAGTNPKLVFQVAILIGSLIIYMAILLFRKVRTGKPIAYLVSEHKQVFTISLTITYALFIVIFLMLFMLNN